MSDSLFRVNEGVVLRASLECIGCGRAIERTAKRDGESVRTGNTTETAKYWLACLANDVAAVAKRRRWEQRETGCVCAHCVAVDADPLGNDQPDMKGAHDAKPEGGA